MEKLLTIAIPTYNRSQTLKRALDAIALQYDERVEVLVCDDASPDNTEEIIAEIRERLPMRYVRNATNLGFDRNFIRCYQEAAGKFVLIMGDDDFLIQGGLKYILSYLEENDDMEWAYLNIAPFEGDCSCLTADLKPKRAEIDKAHITKKEFMDYSGADISALSSIIRRENVQRITDCEKYIGSYFMQTCLWLEATKAENSVLGIIGKACIAYNYSQEDLNVFKNPPKFFKAFYRGLRYTLCVVGPMYGYDEKQMRAIFTRERGGRGVILRMNARKIQGWREAFWSIGYPVIKDIPSVCVRVIPLVFLPSCIASFLVKYGLPIYWKLKKMRR